MVIIRHMSWSVRPSWGKVHSSLIGNFFPPVRSALILITRRHWHLLIMKVVLVYGTLTPVPKKHLIMSTRKGCGLWCIIPLNLYSMHLDQTTALVSHLVSWEMASIPCIIVKMWSANCQHSIFTLDTKANVCSVQFHPHNSFHFAFGSAGKFCSSYHSPSMVCVQITLYTMWTRESLKCLCISWRATAKLCHMSSSSVIQRWFQRKE